MTELPWPTHPDGTNMTIGEMSREDKDRILAAAKARWIARRDAGEFAVSKEDEQ